MILFATYYSQSYARPDHDCQIILSLIVKHSFFRFEGNFPPQDLLIDSCIVQVQTTLEHLAMGIVFLDSDVNFLLQLVSIACCWQLAQLCSFKPRLSASNFFFHLLRIIHSSPKLGDKIWNGKPGSRLCLMMHAQVSSVAVN